MAAADQKYIRTEYTDGSVVLSNLRNKKGIPVVGLDAEYTATKVTTWYDGSVMDDSKADGKVYLKLKDTGEYFKVNLPKDKELFLEKDTIAQFRGLSSTEILLLKMGYYKGIRLNGYYAKGDTPAPIEYYLSDTTENDDGGSVIEVGGVKLQHDFGGYIDTSYFGVSPEKTDNKVYLDAAVALANLNSATLESVDLVINHSSGTRIRTTGTFKLKSKINFICKIPLVCATINTEPFITTNIDGLTTTGVNSRRNHDFNLIYENNQSMGPYATSTGHIGLRLINESSSVIRLRVIGFYIGVQCYATWEFAYNAFYLNRIGNNVIDLNLYQTKLTGASGNGGWVNENTFYNGSFYINNSTLNRDYKKYCVLIESTEGYGNNSNVMYRPSFEAHPTGISDDSYVIYNKSGGTFFIEDARNENYAKYFVREDNTREVSNRYSVSYTNITPAILAPNGSNSQVIVNTSARNKADFMCYNSGILSSQIKTVGTVSVFANGLQQMQLGVNNTPIKNNSGASSGGMTTANGYVSTNQHAVAIPIPVTKPLTAYTVMMKTENGVGGRCFVKAYDSSDNIVTEGISGGIKMVAGSSEVPIKFGDCWGQQSTESAFTFSVFGANIAKIVILVYSTRLISFDILTNNAAPDVPTLVNAHSGEIKNTVTVSGAYTHQNNIDIVFVDQLTANTTITFPNNTDFYGKKVDVICQRLNGYQLTVNMVSSNVVVTRDNEAVSVIKLGTYYSLLSRGSLNAPFAQSANVTNSLATIPAQDVASSATDVPGVVTDLNDLIGKYNLLVTVVTELQSKLNAKLTNDRTSGQQAST